VVIGSEDLRLLGFILVIVCRKVQRGVLVGNEREGELERESEREGERGGEGGE